MLAENDTTLDGGEDNVDVDLSGATTPEELATGRGQSKG